MKYLTIYIIFFFILSINFTYAHGTGESYAFQKDGYEIDVDIDTKDPESGQTIRFDFALNDIQGSGLQTDFDYIWVRIEQGQKIIFAGGIGKASFGSTGLTTVLPEAGSYLLSLRFQKDGEKLVEGETNFDVRKGENIKNINNFSLNSFLLILLGLVVGFAVSYFVRR